MSKSPQTSRRSGGFRLAPIIARTAEIARRFPVRLAAVLLAMAAALSLGGAGDYLNRTAFYHPYLKVRAALGLAPSLDPRLRLILLDDRSLHKLGRRPTFGEWQALADQLFSIGFEKVLFADFTQLAAEVGSVSPRSHAGLFAGGVAAYPSDGNPRGMDPDDLPSRLFASKPGPGVDGVDVAKQVLAPAPAVLGVMDRIGSLNIVSSDAVPIGFTTTKGAFVPYLGLLAASDATLAALPRAAGVAQYFIDFVEERSIYAAALPVSAAFGPDLRLASALSPRVEGKLAGGKVALLIPDAQSGGRFLDSPVGKVPSHFALVAMANGALRGRFVHSPLPHGLAVFAIVPCLWWLLLNRSTRRAHAAAAGLTAVLAIGSLVALYTLGWLFPCAPWIVLGIAGIGTRFISDLFRNWAETLRMSSEIELGRTVQTLLLPAEREALVAGWEVGVVFKPYGTMSGDWFQLLAGEQFGLLAIGDVVGKGTSAALNTATIAGIWHYFTAQVGFGPARLVELCDALNGAVHRTYRGQQNTTLNLAALQPGKITIAAIGAQLWVKKAVGKSSSRVMTALSNPIGMSLDADTFAVKELAVEHGEVFIAYTDGVIDGGVARKTFLSALDALPDLGCPFDRLKEQIGERAFASGSGSTLPDDSTLVVLRYVGSSLPAGVTD